MSFAKVFMLGLMLWTAMIYLFLNGCHRTDENATFYTACESSQREALVYMRKMAGLFCADGVNTIRFDTELDGVDRCVKPDSSTGWYAKFKVTCRGKLP